MRGRDCVLGVNFVFAMLLVFTVPTNGNSSHPGRPGDQSRSLLFQKALRCRERLDNRVSYLNRSIIRLKTREQFIWLLSLFNHSDGIKLKCHILVSNLSNGQVIKQEKWSFQIFSSDFDRRALCQVRLIAHNMRLEGIDDKQYDVSCLRKFILWAFSTT